MGAVLQSALLQPVAFNSHGAKRQNFLQLRLRCHAFATHCLAKPGAGEGNRTLVVSLEGFCSTIELHPLGVDSRLVEGEGFEPSKAEPSDLQSDPFDRSGTPPNETEHYRDVRYNCQTVGREIA